eukprot:CAMPEP_0172165992 /NCGR_PEP_ID=MMETSP1050-20130122/8724_1 /TAXON_ID=233186 /ORGANISM="Cryptomonas curvata, Strain CCAP979/52" /LENGTH=137 /DNA_ID=CAMNT_0012836533 /DNA_START=199 /DNA_END=608 /DNA_ORIENTATION=-
MAATESELAPGLIVSPANQPNGPTLMGAKDEHDVSTTPIVSPTTRFLPSGEMSPASRALVASLAEGAALDHSQNSLKVISADGLTCDEVLSHASQQQVMLQQLPQFQAHIAGGAGGHNVQLVYSSGQMVYYMPAGAG